MRSVCQTFSSAADGQPLLIDRDAVLSYVTFGIIQGSVSSDPNSKASDLTAAKTVLQNLVAAWNSKTAAANGTGGQVRVDFSVFNGEYLYLSATTSGFIQLFFTDPD